MVVLGELETSRLSKEGRTGPGGKPSRQKSPCCAVVGKIQLSRFIMFRNILVVVAVVLVIVMVVATSGKEEKGTKLKGKRHRTVDKNLKEKRELVIRAECLSSEFSCSSGSCIPLDEVCDTHHNCPGGEDEMNCPANCTGPNQFHCEDGSKCIGLIDKCDGSRDCTDYSDEAYCASHECSSGRFHCTTSHECILSSFVCDDVTDCEDHSDEYNCQTASCSSDEILCTDGSRCILNSYVCDGDTDCFDFSDEKGCSCGSDKFQCKTGQCIPTSFKCDGDNDCGDLSDEIDCPALPGNRCVDVMTYEDCFRVNETTHPICLIPADADKFCRKFCGLCQ